MPLTITNPNVVTTDNARNSSTLNSITFTSDTSHTFQGTGSVSGTALTIDAVTSGSIAVGDLVYTGVTETSSFGYLHPFTYITAFGTGNGGTGTYIISEPPTSAIASTTIRCGPNYKNNSITFVDTDTGVANTESNRLIGNVAWVSSDSSSGGAGSRAWIAAKYAVGATAAFGSTDLVLGAGPFSDNNADPALKINGAFGTIEFLSAYGESAYNIGTLTGTASVQLNYYDGNYFTMTNAASSVTLTFLEAPAGNVTYYSFILDITNGGSSPITWFPNTKWAGGTAPTLTASGRDVLGFYTSDYGSTYTGLVLGKDVK